MELEPKKILRNHRFKFWKNRKKKEWWYTGVHDPQSNVYVGFSFFRMDLLDNLDFTIFDPKLKEPFTWSWKGFLDRACPEGQTFLSHKGLRESFSYQGSAEKGWQFSLETKGLVVQMELKATEPYFTKFDNQFVDEYALLHFFHIEVKGSIHSTAGIWNFQQALGYYDHCFGFVPRQSRWHWIAVQNNQFALASLMNYGATPQRYTQGYFTSNAPERVQKHWIRFDQDVSFECHPDFPWDRPWKITSPDMDLRMQILQRSYSPTQIPPIIPFFLNIHHNQCYVKVEGKVRADGEWVPTAPLFGVLEEHVGKW